MTDFKRGDKVQYRRHRKADWINGEFLGVFYGVEFRAAILCDDGTVEDIAVTHVRRAPRVVTQMCQWWVTPYGAFARPVDDPYELCKDWRKVGEPFEQTLEIPE